MKIDIKIKKPCGFCPRGGALRSVLADVDSICERDPAARGRVEVILLYSGFHALAMYRAAHALDKNGAHVTARALSQFSKFLTGIEIHPGAKIGKGLFIDHGSGVVIGETSIIGDNGVMVGAGAKLLGAFTVGDNAKIAAGAVVLRDVPADSTAVGIPARIVKKEGVRVKDDFDLDQVNVPDPVAEELAKVKERLAALEDKLAGKED